MIWNLQRLLSRFSRCGPCLAAAAVCALGLSLCPAAPALAQDDVAFAASVDRTTLTTGDELVLQLTLEGVFSNAGQPRFPALDGFTVTSSGQSSRFSIANGVTSSQVVYTYRLRPTRAGTLTIPSISIQVGQQSYQTDPITVEVTQGAAPRAAVPTSQPPVNGSAPGELAGQDVYVEADVDDPAPVAGQQIVYRFRLYQAIQLFSQPHLDWPDAAGFLSYDLSPNNQYTQDVAGRQYLVTEVRRALFPTTQGETTIPPATLTIPGDFFNREVNLQTQAVTVDVRPLPDGAPDGFGGAVGQFEIESWVEPAETRVDEPVTLLVRVSGLGNAATLPDPVAGLEQALDDWRIYDPQVTTDVSQEGERIRGERLFERPLVPRREGDLGIPALTFVYFDPETGAYRSAETAPLVVSVAAGEVLPPGAAVAGDGKQDVVLLASDVRHIKPAPPSLAIERSSLLAHPLYWVGWLISPATVAGAWLWERRRRHLTCNAGLVRAQRARRVAGKGLAGARSLAGAGDEEAVYGAVARVLAAYLGDKLGLAPAGLTRDAILHELAARSVPGDTVERLLAGLDWADSGRFAPAAAGRGAVELVREAEEIVAALDASIGERTEGARRT
jgi:hypothetical protein